MTTEKKRLVDANKLKYRDMSAGKLRKGLWYVFKDDVDNAATVDAIPVGWIETEISEKILSDKSWAAVENGIDKATLLKAWYILIKEWEKENGTD